MAFGIQNFGVDLESPFVDKCIAINGQLISLLTYSEL